MWRTIDGEPAGEYDGRFESEAEAELERLLTGVDQAVYEALSQRRARIGQTTPSPDRVLFFLNAGYQRPGPRDLWRTFTLSHRLQ